MNIKRYQRLLLAVFSGVLFSLSWTSWHMGIVLFFAFIPLLIIEDYLYDNRQRYRSVQAFLYSYLAFFVWNAISTWWIYYATLFGVVMAVTCNSLFMAIVFWLFHITRRRLGNQLGYFALLVFWLSFEIIHINWDLSWTWLTLGNGFSRNLRLIQWYEFTGVLGGSFWVLMVNILLISIFRNYFFRKGLLKMRSNIIILIFFIIVPITYSMIRFYTYKEKANPVSFVIIQPNIDPYTDKFDGLTEQEQLDIIINLADSLTDENTDFVIGPETALPNGIWENDIETYYNIQTCKNFVNKYPNARFILGVSSYRMYEPGEKMSSTARQYRGTNDYYESYNTSIQIEKGQKIQLYHKSKLVLGVEMMPFPKVFKLLGDFAVELGGISGSLGMQDERDVFWSPNDSIQVAPTICYESIYGEFMTGFIKNGADFILVITNDGWWRDTPGYSQHLSFSSLRAIENRRSIARSANTGISCFINQKGEILQPTGWWVPAAIKGEINSNDKLTFYAKRGDYIGRIAEFFSIIIILYFIVNFITKRGQKQ